MDAGPIFWESVTIIALIGSCRATALDEKNFSDPTNRYIGIGKVLLEALSVLLQ